MDAAPPIVDAHTDVLLELAARRREEAPFRRLWLPALERGGVALQVCPVFAADLDGLPELALRRCLLQVGAFDRAVREAGDRVLAVRSRGDLDAVARGARIGLLLALEGAEPLGYEPSLVDVLHAHGLRMASLTWNRRNPFADGAAEDRDGGLSRLGRELVDRLVALGVVLDLAHASERTFFEALERLPRGAAVCVSHAACRALHATPRNLSDDQLRALAERDGVLGIMLHPLTVDPERPTLERAVDHVDHAASVMGVERVGVAGDFMAQVVAAGAVTTPPDALVPEGMPMGAALEGLEGPADYPRLVEALRARGYEGDRLVSVLGGSFLRLLARALPGEP